MVGLSALWIPIIVSAVFVLIALLIIHGALGWHRDDMIAVPCVLTCRYSPERTRPALAARGT